MNLAAAYNLVSEGRDSEALDVLRPIMSDSPNDGWALNLAAEIENRRGGPQRALELSERACLADPEESDFHTTRADILNDMGRSDDALRACERAQLLDPGNMLAYVLEADVIAGSDFSGSKLKNMLARGRGAAGRAVELAPDNPWTHLAMSRIYSRSELFSEGEWAAREALKLNPALAAGHLYLFIALRGQDRVAEAGNAYLKAYELDPLVDPDRRLLKKMMKPELSHGYFFAASLSVLIMLVQYSGDWFDLDVKIVIAGALGVMAIGYGGLYLVRKRRLESQLDGRIRHLLDS